MHPCPTCKGTKLIKSPDGSLWQMCPKCEGSGEDPGQEVEYFAYKATVVLTANQLTTGKVSINGLLDFKLKLLTRKATGSFRLALKGSKSHSFSMADPSPTTNDRLPDTCFFGDGSLPFVMAPHPIYPRSGMIPFDIEDTSGGANTVELVFHGATIVWG